MSAEELAYLTPEARARVVIDRLLAASGWAVQHARTVNLAASRGSPSASSPGRPGFPPDLEG